MIHIARNGKQEGPYTLDQVNGLLASGRLKPEDSSWWEGCDGWVPVSRIPGVALPGNAAGAQSVYAAPGSVIAPVSHGMVSAGAVQALRETRPWVMLIAIVGLLFTALGFLAALGMFSGAFVAGYAGSRSGAGSPMGGMEGGMLAGMGVVYVVMLLIYLYPLIKLFKYARAISALVRSGAPGDLENALRQQKSFWKFVGVLFLIVILIYAVILGIALLGGIGVFSGALPGSGPSGGGFPPAPSTP